MMPVKDSDDSQQKSPAEQSRLLQVCKCFQCLTHNPKQQDTAQVKNVAS
jgi:hypothetical protein